MHQQTDRFSDVSIISRKAVRIGDLAVNTELDPEKQGAILDIQLDVHNTTCELLSHVIIRGTIQDPGGAVQTPRQSGMVASLDRLGPWGRYPVQLSMNVRDPQLWTAQTPKFYRLLLTVEDAQGNLLDAKDREFAVRESRALRTEESFITSHIGIEWVDVHTRRFRVTNHFDFVALDRFEPRWELRKNGDIMAAGCLDPIGAKPGQTIDVMVPVAETHLQSGCAYELVLSFHLIQKTPWTPQKDYVSSRQFVA